MFVNTKNRDCHCITMHVSSFYDRQINTQMLTGNLLFHKFGIYRAVTGLVSTVSTILFPKYRPRIYEGPECCHHRCAWRCPEANGARPSAYALLIRNWTHFRGSFPWYQCFSPTIYCPGYVIQDGPQYLKNSHAINRAVLDGRFVWVKPFGIYTGCYLDGL